MERYIINLSYEEIQAIKKIIESTDENSKVNRNAHIILACNRSIFSKALQLNIESICNKFNISSLTVLNIRKGYISSGINFLQPKQKRVSINKNNTNKYNHYKIILEQKEIILLNEIIVKKPETQTAKKAKALLLLDEGPFNKKNKTLKDISDMVSISIVTLMRMKKKFVEEGIEAAINRKVQDISTRYRKFDGDTEAHITRIACSETPDGASRWTLGMIQQKLIDEGIVTTISRMTIHNILQKKISNPI